MIIHDLEDKPINDILIVESLFYETTRSGKHVIRKVYLALTPKYLIINNLKESKLNCKYQAEKPISKHCLHPIESLQLSIFKKSQRQALKIGFSESFYRYFQLENTHIQKQFSRFHAPRVNGYWPGLAQDRVSWRDSGRPLLCNGAVYWTLWCKQIIELRRRNPDEYFYKHYGVDWFIFNEEKSPKVTWDNKYLYLGSKRDVEDGSRPSPVPGLGPTEDIKLLYLKPQYFGCWDQSEHWVQCESSSHSEFQNYYP